MSVLLDNLKELNEAVDRAVEKIEKLEKENKELKQGYISSLRVQIDSELVNENAELKAQIEKMKNCGNCKNKKRPETKESIKFCIECKQLDEQKENIILTKWELAE